MAIETTVPGRGRRHGRDARRRATCSAGRGSCRPTATPSTPARSGRPTRSPSTAPACAASATRDPALGYDLLKLAGGRVRRAPPGHAAAAAGPLRERPPMAEPPLRLPRRPTSGARRPTRGRCGWSRATRAAAAPFAAGQFAMLYAFGVGRGADLGQRHGRRRRARAHRPRRRRGDARDLRRASRATCSASAGRSATAWPVAAAEGRDVSLVAGGHRAARRCGPVVHALLARPRALRAASRSSTAGARPPSCSTATSSSAWRRGGDVDVERDRRRADGRLARAASASSRG